MSLQRDRLGVLAAFSGVMISLQARANGELSYRLGSGIEAALVSFTTGLIIISFIALINPAIKQGIRNLKESIELKKIPRWTLFAGMLGSISVGFQTSVVPIVGVAIFSVASIAGQVFSSLFVDRLGLTGGGKKSITRSRVAAALVTALAVYVSVSDRIDANKFSHFAVTGAAIAGAIIGFQRALNGRINENSKMSFTTSLLNFFMGTALLALVLIVLVFAGGVDLAPLPAGPWWIYTGGLLGVIYIASTSLIVQHLGVLTFTLFNTIGILTGSLIIDYYFPSKGVHVSMNLVIGIVLTMLGVVVSGVGNSRMPRLLRR
jgi:transporter family-2 protein